MRKFKVHFCDGNSGMFTLCGASQWSVKAYHVNEEEDRKVTCKKCRKIAKARRRYASARGLIYV
jgi:hypothetical protein